MSITETLLGAGHIGIFSIVYNKTLRLPEGKQLYMHHTWQAPAQAPLVNNILGTLTMPNFRMPGRLRLQTVPSKAAVSSLLC